MIRPKLNAICTRVPRHAWLQRAGRQEEPAIRRVAQRGSRPVRREMPRRAARNLRGVRAWQGSDRQEQCQGPRLHYLPHQPRDHQYLAGLVQAPQHRGMRQLPQGKPQVLPRHLSRPSHQAGLCRNRQVLQLPRQPRDTAGEGPQVQGASRQPPEDLPGVS